MVYVPKNANQSFGALLLTSPQVFSLETLAGHPAGQGRCPDPQVDACLGLSGDLHVAQIITASELQVEYNV